ncbi:response regulator [Salimicrobium jeotgali]|uniref:Response regulator n=3 Tax=Salimicrobium TaxID=351195 RepID=K2GCX2_9BACI|nr:MULTISPECIES: response regulator [Salimicrobium]AKG03600.1 response regulator [Salimicrobium jeotgali]EKE32097.1 two-component response regulator [Salimicrobium jeotgali]MBM7696065.1 two-component system response regulator DctR [Salimicrobium jeotgali]PBB07109.1 response regulator [Salimicrobium humidisoli]SIS80126.1 two-component system, CitB family, response regulator DctR [Salimicrobium salexigens]
MNILIIDNDESLRYMLTEFCNHAGWQSNTAVNGREGVDLFQREKFDIILVDYHMPEMDGLQTVKEIRKQNQQVPILVLTVDERQEIADRFLEEGATDFALKPVKAPDLISRIQLHVKLANMRSVHEESEEIYSAKGISKNTLSIIAEHLKKEEEPASVDVVSKEIGLAYPTVYRYLMHLLEEGQVKQVISHQKIGRPKKLYKWYTK